MEKTLACPPRFVLVLWEREKRFSHVVVPLTGVSLRFVVHGLTTGEQYVFRVKAVNAVGTSENSQESDVIKVQAALSE